MKPNSNNKVILIILVFFILFMLIINFKSNNNDTDDTDTDNKNSKTNNGCNLCNEFLTNTNTSSRKPKVNFDSNYIKKFDKNNPPKNIENLPILSKKIDNFTNVPDIDDIKINKQSRNLDKDLDVKKKNLDLIQGKNINNNIYNIKNNSLFNNSLINNKIKNINKFIPFNGISFRKYN